MEGQSSSERENRHGTPPEVPSSAAQHALSETLRSTPFRGSKQSQRLLRYIVDQTLAGHTELLKERMIGVNVFGRQLDYDTNEDPIVRARAAEVRKRLAQFYLGEGSHSTVRIVISPGAYAATFSEYGAHSTAAPVAPAVGLAEAESPRLVSPSVTVPEDQSRPLSPSRWPRRLTWLFSVVVALCLAVVAWFQLRPISAVDLFWQPFINTPSAVLMYSGANAVYLLSPEFIKRYKSTHRLDDLKSQGLEFVVPISPDTKLGPEDLIGYKNDYLTIGDLAANVRVASLLANHHQRFDLRLGDDVAFGDLRQSPTILIGAFNNSLTLELTGDLPFNVYGAQVLSIREQGSSGRTWTPVYAPDSRVIVDYALVTRMPRSKTGQVLIAIAGLTQKGTQGAADFVADPEQIKKLAASAPKDWWQKNLQFILQMKVVDNAPTSPTIVAIKTW
jgi:hypothetical protein